MKHSHSGPTSIIGFLMAFLFLTLGRIAVAESPEPIKVGALTSGTLNWELAVIRDQGIDKTHGIRIETTELSSPEAGRIGLQGKSVDLIVSDWIWVARERLRGHDFVFAPYSSNHGALMVPQDSPIKELPDLAGKRLGIAGGAMDKNWLLLKAAAFKTSGLDLEKQASINFASPPLLNQSLQQGALDALLTYWNHAAKLQTMGFREVMGGREIQKSLGIDADIPALGYVFRDSWASAHLKSVEGFMSASIEARRRLCESDEAWQSVTPLTQEKDPGVQKNLRKHYCDGRITAQAKPDQKAAAKIFELVNTQSHESDRPFPEGTFWAPREPESNK